MARGNNKRQASIRTEESGPVSPRAIATAKRRLEEADRLVALQGPLKERYEALRKRWTEGDPAEEARYKAAQKRHADTWDAVAKFPADSPERKEWEEKEHRPYVDELRRHTSLERSIKERADEVYRELTAVNYKLRKLREKMEESSKALGKDLA